MVKPEVRDKKSNDRRLVQKRMTSRQLKRENQRRAAANQRYNNRLNQPLKSKMNY